MSYPDFEKKIAQELQDRELAPSEESWAKLQAQLDHGKKEGVFKLWWLGAAATLVFALMIWNSFDSQVLEPTPEIVDTPYENRVNEFEEAASPKIAAEEMLPEKREKVSQEVLVQEVQPSQPVVSVEEERPEVIPAESASGMESAEHVEEQEFSRSDAREAIAAIAGETGGDYEVTDAEIDALLSQAMAEVQKEQESIKTAPIAAEDLLEEVETELERSFRRKVLDLLKEGLIRTKTAVANTIE